MADKRLNYTAEEINNILDKANTLEIPTVPTKVSELINDSDFATFNDLHSHNNKTILDSITQNDIDKWNNSGTDNGSEDITEIINARTTAKGEVHDGLANKTYASLSARLDFMDSRRVDKTRMAKNVKDYGARGGWSSVPASTYYSTLEALKVDFPLAQSLNDEMDTLAIEKLVNTVNNSIYIPNGGYMINRQINIAQGVCISGDGKYDSILQWCGNEDTKTSLFKCTNKNITIKNLEIYHEFTAEKKGADTEYITAITGTGCEHCTYSDLYIVGFDTALQFGENSWDEFLTRCRIQSCNIGITGNGEFNNIVIRDCYIGFCKNAVIAGAGRNILINGCAIEGNNNGVIKRNIGDIVIKDNYFELNNEGNITIQWWDSSVDMAIIEGNSFFTSTSLNEKMIQYHTMEDRLIVIRNNNFQGYQLASTCNILIPTNNTLVKPIFVDNRWQKSGTYAGFEIGVTSDKINIKDYYENGKHMYYSSSFDLSSVMTDIVSSVRINFLAGEIITLPDFTKIYDNTKCFKIVALATSSTNTTDRMSFDETNHSILGIKSIEPNQIYSIYFNRVNDSKNEIIVLKG